MHLAVGSYLRVLYRRPSASAYSHAYVVASHLIEMTSIAISRYRPNADPPILDEFVATCRDSNPDGVTYILSQPHKQP
jgi:hypothetical protein